MNTTLDDPNDYNEYDDVDKALDLFLLASHSQDHVKKAIKRIDKNIRKQKIKKLLDEAETI